MRLPPGCPEDVVLIGPEGKWSWFSPWVRFRKGAEDTPFLVALDALSTALGVQVEERLLGSSKGLGCLDSELVQELDGGRRVEFRSLPHLTEVCNLLFQGRDREARCELEECSSSPSEASLDWSGRDGQARRVEAAHVLEHSIAEHGYFWLLSDARYAGWAEQLVASGERWLCTESKNSRFEGIGCKSEDAWKEGVRWRYDLWGSLLERVRGRLWAEREGVLADDRLLPPTRVVVDAESGGRWLRTAMD